MKTSAGHTHSFTIMPIAYIMSLVVNVQKYFSTPHVCFIHVSSFTLTGIHQINTNIIGTSYSADRSKLGWKVVDGSEWDFIKVVQESHLTAIGKLMVKLCNKHISPENRYKANNVVHKMKKITLIMFSSRKENSGDLLREGAAHLATKCVLSLQLLFGRKSITNFKIHCCLPSGSNQ